MKSGYIPGDLIDIELMLRNESPKEIKGMDFKVVKVAIFKASCGTTRKQYTTILNEFKVNFVLFLSLTLKNLQEFFIAKEASATILHQIIAPKSDDETYSFDTGNICQHFEIQVDIPFLYLFQKFQLRVKYGKKLSTTYLALSFAFARSRNQPETKANECEKT